MFFRKDLEELKTVTCTDKKCIWNAPHKSTLQKYETQPLRKHKCFSCNRTESEETEDITNNQLEEDLLRNIMITDLPTSALAYHM